MLPELLVCCCLLLLFGIVLNRYDADSLLRTLYKKLIFLYQHLDFKDSKPNFDDLALKLPTTTVRNGFF